MTSLVLDDFLGHETRSAGGNGTQYLRGWRKKTPAAVNTVLHRRSPIYALWQHGLPRIFDRKDEDGETVRVIYGSTWNCLEHEDVLKRQYKRDRDTGERLTPPVVCPVCRLLEHLRDLYNKGDLTFAQKVFEWSVDSSSQSLSLGGMLNMYGSDKLTDEEEAEMKRARVRVSDAWKENCNAKCNYAFVVVDVDAAEAGVQIAVETTALGDVVKECIKNQITALGDDGNPIKNPYVIRWEHHPTAKEFSKRYKAIAMPRIALTQNILTLIDSAPPDMDSTIRPGNITALRADLESACLVDCIDWDHVFGPAERAGLGKREDRVDTEEPAAKTTTTRKPAQQESKPKATEQKATPVAESKPATTGGRKRKEPVPEPEPEPEPESIAPDAERIACDECGNMMLVSDTKCDRCGAEYENTDDEPAPEPPKKVEPPKATVPATAAKGTRRVNF